jgi:tRNA A-37 threonylcarbamoyl transferase component Bud32
VRRECFRPSLSGRQARVKLYFPSGLTVFMFRGAVGRTYDTLHAYKVVHGDVEPRHVIFPDTPNPTDHCTPLLIDFDRAVIVSECGESMIEAERELVDHLLSSANGRGRSG